MSDRFVAVLAGGLTHERDVSLRSGRRLSAALRTTTQDATHQKWALIPVPEPVNFNTKQIDAKLNFTSGKLFITGGYYGSFFTNANGTVTPIVPGSLMDRRVC